MQTYWDLSEKERAALTRDEVQRFVDAELMLKGVLAPAKLEFVPVPAAPEASTTFYRPRTNRYTAVDVAFETEREAREFLGLDPVLITKDWQLGDVEIATPIADATIEAVSLVMNTTAEIYKSQLQSIKAAKDENDRRRRAHDEQQKKADSALQGLWDDWQECGAKARSIRAIQETREKYLQLSGGDEATAQRFLALVHSEAELAEAAAWGDAKPAALPVKDAKAVDEIPF